MFLKTEYHLAFAILCLLLAIASGWFLYRKNPLKLASKHATKINYFLGTIRTIAVFTILFLLLGPLLKWIQNKTEKPIVIVAIDNSKSIVNGKDSTYNITDFPENIKQLISNLEDNYEVKNYTFGSNIKINQPINFKDAKTDIHSLFEEVKSNFENRNLGAIILASDGIYNQGESPTTDLDELSCPVYTIALGDTIQYKDAILKNIRNNAIAFSGNSFTIQIDISTFGFKGKQTSLKIECDGNMVKQLSFTPNSDNYFTTQSIALTAPEIGNHHYLVSINPYQDELNKSNNRKDFFIQVVSQKQKISLISLAPHPDLSAIIACIKNNENFVFETHQANEISMPSNDISLVIAHQIPSINGLGSAYIKACIDRKIPILFILGSQTGLQYLPELSGNSISIINSRGGSNEVTPVFNNDFSYFTLSDEIQATIKKLPPLNAPYGNYKISSNSEVLFNQQIGNVPTNYPLIFFNSSSENKVGFICGEGFWKWYLNDFNISKHQSVEGLLNQMIQFLIEKKDNSPFKIYGAKEFDETEKITFNAELYNESGVLTNTPDALFKITNQNGKSYSFAFSKIDNTYSVDAGVLTPGKYSYEATVSLGNKLHKSVGKFVVLTTQLEFIQTVANHQLLNEMANITGGQMLFPQQINTLPELLDKNKKLKSILYKEETLTELINFKWIFMMIVGLLTIEWFIRKWNGTI